jgi:hypothetical protein
LYRCCVREEAAPALGNARIAAPSAQCESIAIKTLSILVNRNFFRWRRRRADEFASPAIEISSAHAIKMKFFIFNLISCFRD